MMRVSTAVLSCGLAASGGDLQLRREGGYWIQSRTEDLAIPADCRLHVYTFGRIAVLGTDTDRSTLTLTQSVRAGSESQALVRLRQSAVTTATSPGGTAVVRVHRTGQPAVATEMRIGTRRDLAHVILDTEGGDIQAENLAGHVDAESGGGFIRIARIGGDITARTAGGEVHLGRIGGSVRCFSGGGSIRAAHTGSESWFETAGGEIYIGETRGPLYASTHGGNIHIGRAGSSVYARTAGGRIEVEHADGIVMAGNSAGSIHIGTAQGVRCESTGGSIRLKAGAGALRAVTDTGSILAELFPGFAIKDSVLATGAGDITVYIPSNVALTIKALSDSRIVSEFAEIPVRRSGAEGALNGGGPLLTLTSASGTIYLRRQR
jgi:hypothetical protein